MDLTNNQRRVLELAEQAVLDPAKASQFSDVDWALLLLAAGMRRRDVPARLIAAKVLTHYARRRGYFALAHDQDKPSAAPVTAAEDDSIPYCRQ